MKLPYGRRAHESARPTWQPIPAWRWMLAAAAAVVITAFVVTIWLLAIASHANPGTDQANARLDAVRTGLAAGAGAGAAVGLMLAFRRQHHQEIATDLTDRDATERRITDLYTKASSNSATTRPRSGSAACTHSNGSPRTTPRTARPSSTSYAPTYACRLPRRRQSAGRSRNPPKPRTRLPRLKRLTTLGTKKDRCALPRSASLPTICVMTGRKVSAPPSLRTRVAGLTSASISSAPLLSTSALRTAL